MNEHLFLILDMSGTIAFAISGAMMGVRKRMDLFGILILSMITATGGGITRDVVIGSLPPLSLVNPAYFIAAFASGICVFLFYSRISSLKNSIRFFDALGLGIFTVSGIQAAQMAGLNPLSVVLLGTLTGIGGGIYRDVLSGTIPFVFQKELYASISLTGGVLHLILQPYIHGPLLSYGTVFFIVLFRLISLKANWRLPLSGEESFLQKQDKPLDEEAGNRNADPHNK